MPSARRGARLNGRVRRPPASARIERSVIGSATRIASSAPARPARAGAPRSAPRPLDRRRRGRRRPLARGAVERDEHACAALDLLRRAAGRARRGADALVQRGEALDAVAVVLPPRVPGVGVRERDPEHARPVAADHQRQAPRGRRQQDGVVGLPEAARERDPLAVQQAAHDRERLLEARHAMVVRDPEGAELLLVPAGAEAEHEAPAADLVDRRGHLRDQARRVEAGAGDERTEPHPLGRGGEGGQQRPRLPGPALGPAVAAVEQVVAEPDRVEAAGFGRAGHGEVLGPAHLALHLGKLDSDSHVAQHYPLR